MRIRLIPRDTLALIDCEAETGKLPEDLIVTVPPEGQWGEMESDPSVVGGILRDGVGWKRCSL